MSDQRDQQRSFEDVEEIPVVIRPLRIPKFQSAIPEDMMENLGKRDRNVVETLSVMAQWQDWTRETTEYQHECLMMLERRLIRVERFVRLLSSRWSIITAGILWLAPYVVPKLLNWIASGTNPPIP